MMMLFVIGLLLVYVNSQATVFYSFQGTVGVNCSFKVTEVSEGVNTIKTYDWNDADIFATEMAYCLTDSVGQYQAVMYFIDNKDCGQTSNWEQGSSCGCPRCTGGTSGQTYNKNFAGRYVFQSNPAPYDTTKCYECTADSNGKFDSCSVTAKYERDFENADCPPVTCTDNSQTYTYGDVWFGTNGNSQSSCKRICTCAKNDLNEGTVSCVDDVTSSNLATTSDIWDGLWKLCSSRIDGCRGSSTTWGWSGGENTCDGTGTFQDCPQCRCTQDTTALYDTDGDVYQTCVDCDCEQSGNGNYSSCTKQWDYAEKSTDASSSNCPGPIQCYESYEENILQNISISVGCPPNADSYCGAYSTLTMSYDAVGTLEQTNQANWRCMPDFLCGADGILTGAGCARENITVPVWQPNCTDYSAGPKTDVNFIAALSCSSGTQSNYYDLDTCQGDAGNADVNATTSAPCNVWDNVETINGQTCTSNDDLDAFWDAYYTCVYSQEYSTNAYSVAEFCGQSPNRFSRCDYIQAKARVESGCLCWAASETAGTNLWDKDGWEDFYHWQNAIILQEKDDYECSGVTWECTNFQFGYFRVQRSYKTVTFDYTGSISKEQISEYGDVPYEDIITYTSSNVVILFDTDDEKDTFFNALTGDTFGWAYSNADKGTGSSDNLYAGTSTTDGTTPVPTPTPTSIIITTASAHTYTPFICFIIAAILPLLF